MTRFCEVNQSDKIISQIIFVNLLAKLIVGGSSKCSSCQVAPKRQHGAVRVDQEPLSSPNFLSESTPAQFIIFAPLYLDFAITMHRRPPAIGHLLCCSPHFYNINLLLLYTAFYTYSKRSWIIRSCLMWNNNHHTIQCLAFCFKSLSCNFFAFVCSYSSRYLFSIDRDVRMVSSQKVFSGNRGRVNFRFQILHRSYTFSAPFHKWNRTSIAHNSKKKTQVR